MRRVFDFLLETLGRLRPAVIVAIAASLVALVDELMYSAKSRGKDRLERRGIGA
jgi:hypothetical protein